MITASGFYVIAKRSQLNGDPDKRNVLCNFINISSHSSADVLSVVTAPPVPIFYLGPAPSHLYMFLIKTQQSAFPLRSR